MSKPYLSIAERLIKPRNAIRPLPAARAAFPRKFPHSPVMRSPSLAVRILTRYLIASLLSFVACRQFYFAHTRDLTSWLGGGMGMFATIDGLDYRVVRARLTTGDGQEQPLDVRASGRLRKLEGDIRAMPAPERLERLGRHLALHTDAPVAASIRIECWRMGLDPEVPAVLLTKLTEGSLDIARTSPAVAASP